MNHRKQMGTAKAPVQVN